MKDNTINSIKTKTPNLMSKSQFIKKLNPVGIFASFTYDKSLNFCLLNSHYFVQRQYEVDSNYE